MKQIKTESYTVDTKKKINKKICLISDIHHDKFINKKFYNKLLLKIKSTQPDIIIIAGDIVDYAKELRNIKTSRVLEYFIQNLGNIAKTIVSVGNHDLRYSKWNNKNSNDVINFLNQSQKFNNIYFINNDKIKLENLELIHYTPTNEWFTNRHRDEFYNEFMRYPIKIAKNNNYKILISHAPDIIIKNENYKKLPEIAENINLIISGHMHNGALPEFLEFMDFKKTGIGIISPLKKPFPKYCRGRHKVGKIEIIISRGIRKFNFAIFRLFNFLYSSEITIIDLI